MKVPARELWNRTCPITFPARRKPVQHMIPIKIQKKTTLETSLCRAVWFLEACNSATVGINIEDMELVTAEGKRIHGSAIPVRTP